MRPPGEKTYELESSARGVREEFELNAIGNKQVV